MFGKSGVRLTNRKKFAIAFAGIASQRHLGVFP